MSESLPSASHAPRFAVDFAATLRAHGHAVLRGTAITTLQINVGKVCNQACQHCHVEAGPRRTERMTRELAERVIALMQATPTITTVDITGGAPELNPSFRRLVMAASQSGREVIDRCNLTILFEPGQDDLAEFLAEQRVHVIASLPCYSPGNVDKQRGKGVFDASIRALCRLNELGYGRPGSGLVLDLVYNPVGASLPPSQAALESDYKRRLAEDFGIRFDRLYTITNMPISRFAHFLEREGKWDQYMALLVQHFNPGTVSGLMCRSQVNVGYDGKLYDCDFNQMLDMELGAGTGERERPPTIWDIDSFAVLDGRRIATDGHCFGCTAGAGSSCGGALAA